MNESQSVGWTLGLPAVALAKAGGEGWIRTSVRLRGQIYSLLPLTTRPPLHEEFPVTWAGAPHGEPTSTCQRNCPFGSRAGFRGFSGGTRARSSELREPSRS